MIKNFILTGDCHGEFNHFNKLLYQDYDPKETAVIILGDVGVNYFLGIKDREHKDLLSSFGYTIYCIRGNHEYRPNIQGEASSRYDENVKNVVWVDPDFPNIRFFIDGMTYNLNGIQTLVLGGAASVDKDFRIANNWMWDPTECLSEDEKYWVKSTYAGTKVDMILSHTCPESWQPTDLFMAGVDQKKVDKNMEEFLEEIADAVDWSAWCWGHFHATRRYGELESKPGRTRLMIFQDFIPLEDIIK